MYQVIVQDMMGFFLMYIREGICYALVVFVLTFLFASWYKKNSPQKNIYIVIIFKSAIMSLLVLYLYIVIGITLLSREKQFDLYMNLKLLSTFNKCLVDPKYIYENILMLVPLAILLYALTPMFRNIVLSLFTGFCTSLAIEIVQLVTGLGRFILDDILTNTIGMLAGYLMCRLVNWIWNIKLR